MKKVLASVPFLIALLFATPVAAVGEVAKAALPNAPAVSVWMTPAKAKKGDAVVLNAYIYNSTAKTITASVLFSTPEDDIATINLTLPAQSAKTATSDWIVPETQTVVTASVIKAVDANQKNIPELLGPIGTVTTGTASTFSIESLGIGAKTWVGTVFSTIEPWRIKQADYFIALRDTTKKELGVDESSDVLSQLTLQNKNPEVPALPGEERPAQTATQRAFPIGKYGTLIYASALASIFASVALFYITVALLLILILRFFFRLFS
jgi:hypothetical protein